LVAAKSDLLSAGDLSDPTDVLRVGVQIQTAKCDIKAGLYDEALELLLPLVDQRKIEDTDIVYFADLLIDSGQTGRSLRLAHAALASDSLNNPDALRYMSGHACLEGQNELAFQFLEHALRKDASHFGCLTDLGWICFLDGQADRAEALLRKAIAVDPNNAHPRCSLAWLLSREQASDSEISEGLEIAQSMLDLPGYPRHRKYKVLARCQLHAGMRDEASESIQHALSCAPPAETEGLQEFIRTNFGDLDPH
jgi:tetratricopeptide (TPR) repeat protein